MNRSQFLGGLIAPSDEKDVGSNLIPPGSSLFVNARSALDAVLKYEAPSRVFLPDFFCPTILDVITQHELDLHYFHVSRNLKSFEDQFIQSLKPNDLVVLIDYFGFPVADEIFEKIFTTGAKILQDSSQAFFNEPNKTAKYQILSPRKFLPLTDGGILVTLKGDFRPLPRASAPSSWVRDYRNVLLNRSIFDSTGQESNWYQEYRTLEDFAPIGDIKMTNESRHSLETAFDKNKIGRKRRENFSYLLGRIKHLAVYRELPEGVIPLGFPIGIKKRDDVQKSLFKDDIYCPIHWDGLKHELSKKVLTLPCDQRYSEIDMDFLCNKLAVIEKRYFCG